VGYIVGVTFPSNVDITIRVESASELDRQLLDLPPHGPIHLGKSEYGRTLSPW
jgi:hypothetical protein